MVSVSKGVSFSFSFWGQAMGGGWAVRFGRPYVRALCLRVALWVVLQAALMLGRFRLHQGRQLFILSINDRFYYNN
jgi:hypothetical protein